MMNKILLLSKYCFPIVFALLIFSCSEENVNDPPPAYVYKMPQEINDGWETANIQEVGIKEDKLSDLIDLINFKIIKNIDGILIVKDDMLVFEEYFDGHEYNYNSTDYLGQQINYDIETPHHLASVTKSFTSALVGIAIDKGFIGSVNEKIFVFFPEYTEYNTGEKQNMTIEHLLTMSAGFEWNESDVAYGNSSNDLIQMWRVTDPLEYLVSKPLSHSPGTHFYYNSGCTNLLGEIIYKASGLKPDIFADKYLFNKLGFVSSEWERFSNGVVYVSGDLKIVPRDMAKFGHLYLKEGILNNEQLLPKEWVVKSVEQSMDVNNLWQYGYKWWLRNYGAGDNEFWSYSAKGWGGQQITIIPNLNMVVVFTGGNFVDGDPVDQIIAEYILPSVI